MIANGACWAIRTAKRNNKAYLPPFCATLAGALSHGTPLSSLTISGVVAFTIADVEAVASLVLGGSWTAEQTTRYDSNADGTPSIGDVTYVIDRLNTPIEEDTTPAVVPTVETRTIQRASYTGLWAE